MSSQESDSSQPSLEKVMHHSYVAFQLPDSSTPAGKKFAQRLHDEPFIWLTTVDEEGTPHSLPVAFLWDEEQSTFLIYSATGAERERMAHIQRNPRVGLHFGSGDVIVITGEVSVSTDDPPSDQVPGWLEKYQEFFSQMGMTMQRAAEAAPIALRVRPLLLRYVQVPG